MTQRNYQWEYVDYFKIPGKFRTDSYWPDTIKSRIINEELNLKIESPLDLRIDKDIIKKRLNYFVDDDNFISFRLIEQDHDSLIVLVHYIDSKFTRSYFINKFSLELIKTESINSNYDPPVIKQVKFQDYKRFNGVLVPERTELHTELFDGFGLIKAADFTPLPDSLFIND
jgi:hypothetical protein